MGRTKAAPLRRSRAIRSILFFALALSVLLALPLLAAAAPVTIDVTNDANQSPVFATFTDSLLLNPATWNEFLYAGRAYPILAGHTSEKSLPTVHVFAPVPDGKYWVFANLYGQSTNSYRYYYSYSAGTPSKYSVDVGPQADCTEVGLVPVNVIDGQFDIYFQKADATSGPENYFGWAWVRLVPMDATMTSSPASSAWSLWLLGGIGAAVATYGVRRLAT